MRTLSLGFSCQTRFAIDEVSADHRRMPFDFLITTRDGLLTALRSRGASLAPEWEALSVFTMPQEGRQGPEANGLYFWHDYPVTAGVLAANWREAAAQVADKYRALWARFEALLADPDEPKRLILSNTQDNLSEFATPETFGARFGLTAAFHRALVEALDAMGARNYRIVFLSRRIEEVVECRAGISDPRFSSRFGGVQALPVLSRFAVNALGPPPEGMRLPAICGGYEDGWTLVAARPGVALAYRDEGSGPVPMGELAEAADGYLFVFHGAPNYVFRVLEEPGGLRFTTPVGGPKPRWRRLG